MSFAKRAMPAGSNTLSLVAPFFLLHGSLIVPPLHSDSLEAFPWRSSAWCPTAGLGIVQSIDKNYALQQGSHHRQHLLFSSPLHFPARALPGLQDQVAVSPLRCTRPQQVTHLQTVSHFSFRKDLLRICCKGVKN